MVRIGITLSKEKRTFIDSIRINICGGRGGNGLPKYGGVGGKGGDVYLEAHKTCSLLKLKSEFPKKRIVAGPGADSKRFCVLGNPGTDVVVKCPPGVSVITDQKIKIGEVNREGEKVLLCKGGCGGDSTNGYIGQKGEIIPVVLDLKLIADVGFVGFPNAGKSSLLKALSRAQPKIASYPFTTIQPNIGTICYKDYRKITAADLPGLIEGSHLNRGMGHKFLKHCLRTKILLFVVDINGFRLNPFSPHRNAMETILFLNRELELYSEELVYKPAILAVNKSDTDEDGTKFEAFKESMKNIKALSKNAPPEMSPEVLINFDAIIPISALKRTNIPLLMGKIRTLIDIYQKEKEAKVKEEAKWQKAAVCTNSEDNVIYV